MSGGLWLMRCETDGTEGVGKAWRFCFWTCGRDRVVSSMIYN